MGNSITISCSCSRRPVSRRPYQSATLLDPHGQLRWLDLPLRAAELMLDYPGHVISSLDGLLKTGRFTPLTADEEILSGKCHVAVPRSRANSRASDAEMAAIGSARKGRSGREIFRHGVVLGEEKGKEEEKVLTSCRRSQRQWNPVLEPIFEN